MSTQPKPGRPSGSIGAYKDPEDKRINRSFKASNKEWQLIQVNAKKANMNVSEYIRSRTAIEETE